MLAYALTLGRLVLAAGFAVCAFGAWRAAGGGPVAAGWTAVLLVVVAAAELTDLLDGIAARRRGTAGRLGGLVDPLCDSLSRLTMYFAAALAGWVTLAVPLVMVGRDLVVAYVRTVRALAGGPTSARFSGKVKAIVQGAGLLGIVLLAAGGAAGWAAAGRTAVAVCVIAVTGWSFVDYVRAGWHAATRLYRSERNA